MEKHEPELSIVIISWNTSELLRDCLDSIKASGQPDSMEVVVVDNASSDGSCEMVMSDFPNVKLIRNAENRGFAAANNQAIRESRGHYVLLLNSDTLILGDVLCRSIEYMHEHPEVAVLGCRVLNPDRTMQPTCFRYPTLLNLALKTTGLFRLTWLPFFGREHLSNWNRDTPREVDVVTGCYMMVRREAINTVGLLDESFFFCGEETDWCRRFKKGGWIVQFSPVGEIVHYGGASGRQLNHRRDLILTRGLLQYHLKHNGVCSMLLAWLLLLLFSALRMVIWGILRYVPGPLRARANGRYAHFKAVTLSYQEAWPGYNVKRI